MRDDQYFLQKAIDIALASEKKGNLPVGAVIVLDNEILAEGPNELLLPEFHPGRHAEMQALNNIPAGYWHRAIEMTCYTTLEPCVMCCGSMLLHRIGRVVFGAFDPMGGAKAILPYLPEYYNEKGRVFEWVGPLNPEKCDPLYQRAAKRFDRLF